MYMHADFTSTSELPFTSLERVLVLSVSRENDLIFMIGLFIHELLREPLIPCVAIPHFYQLVLTSPNVNLPYFKVLFDLKAIVYITKKLNHGAIHYYYYY